MSSYYLCDTCGYFVRSDFDVWLCDIIPRLPRRVAARLRKKYGERHGTFEPQCIEIQASNRMDDLLDCLPKRRDMLLDLADFIEPEPERTCRIEYV